MVKQLGVWCRLFCRYGLLLYGFLAAGSGLATEQTPLTSTPLVSTMKVGTILGQIELLENNSDPKCYATASRLQDFMFGTPLNDNARFSKNQRQKQWIHQLWQRASKIAAGQQQQQIGEAAVLQALKSLLQFSENDKGHWMIDFVQGESIQIHHNDKRQYGSIAYSLRSLLAVQQESLLALDDDNLPLTQAAVDLIADALDLFSLAVLKVADHQARGNNEHQITEQTLLAVWDELSGDWSGANKVAVKQTPAATVGAAKPVIELKLLRAIVEQKVRSYAAYNEISNQLFIRNLQVFFARNRWPGDAQGGKAFRQLFTETLIAFASDFYTGAQQVALKKGHQFITEADVSEFTQSFVPHRINQYEDAIFFPKLSADEQVTIEAYDMDAFRDSGIHWRYLQFAVLDPQYQAYLEPDPFALELLVENIAQFGVLLLRVTGQTGRDAGEKRITLKHFKQAMASIQSRVTRNGQVKATGDVDSKMAIKSSAGTASEHKAGEFFTDITATSGIDSMHRSSDWLNRLLRSYLETGKDTGTSIIPPAFGGSGVAAGDINNDGLTDVLVLSGLGNRLYLNQGDGTFADMTKTAGLSWTRQADKQPGEPRQPLIADLDNDGWQDIVITYVDDSHRVYRNLGGEKFADATELSGLGGRGLVGGPATVFDFDNDGLLDIYITYFGDYIHGVLPTLKRRNNNGLANKLFRNLGGFKFKDVTKGSGLDNTGWGQAVTHTDFDGDGMQDLILGNDFGVNAYFKNLGNGKFDDISATIGTDKPSYTMGIGTADLNGDLLPDIYISNIVTMNKDEKYVLPDATTTMKFNPDKLANMRVIEANDLFLSNKEFSNKELSNKEPANKDKAVVSYQPSELVGRGYSSTGWSWDADFFDFDNDGDDDLYVLNGMNEFNLYGNENKYYTDPLENKSKNVYIPVATKESNVFFNNDNGRLNNVSKQSGVDLLGNSRSAVYLDMDNDGDLDMVLNNYHEKAVVYRNNSQMLNNNWLKIKLVGAPKQQVNLDAIGAQIILTTKDSAKRWRTIQGSTGYMSVHPKVQHFGLNQHHKADILIKWPNGKQTTLKDIAANQTLIVKYAQ